MRECLPCWHAGKTAGRQVILVLLPSESLAVKTLVTSGQSHLECFGTLFALHVAIPIRSTT